MQPPDEREVMGPAPDVQFEDAQGAAVPLSGLWARGPLALVFMRHLG